jgi:hypothetical protein
MKKLITCFFLIFVLTSCNYKYQKSDSTNVDKNNILKISASVTNSNVKKQKPDTTIFKLCDIEKDGQIDTIAARVYLKSDTIYLLQYWKKENEIIWSELTKDSYLTTLADIKEKDKWIKNVIDNALPDIFNIEDYHDLLKGSIEVGMNDIVQKGYKISKEEFEDYLNNYQGCLISWGHPEQREGLFIWYKPLKKFIEFYRP